MTSLHLMSGMKKDGIGFSTRYPENIHCVSGGPSCSKRSKHLALVPYLHILEAVK